MISQRRVVDRSRTISVTTDILCCFEVGFFSVCDGGSVCELCYYECPFAGNTPMYRYFDRRRRYAGYCHWRRLLTRYSSIELTKLGGWLVEVEGLVYVIQATSKER